MTVFEGENKGKRSRPNREVREEEENNLPQMKPLFFLYVWLNLTRPECFRDKENLVKHIRKRTIQTGRLFFSSSLIIYSLLSRTVVAN